MKEERKSVIRSLVHRYTAVDAAADGTQVPKPWTADFIQNKGEGQIFLLHGSPGVGKTYVSHQPLQSLPVASLLEKNVLKLTVSLSKTSECIAEATRRPLLSLTCGDIGTNEVTAERTLSKWFRLAETWGAVMLLDEADVFQGFLRNERYLTCRGTVWFQVSHLHPIKFTAEGSLTVSSHCSAPEGVSSPLHNYDRWGVIN